MHMIYKLHNPRDVRTSQYTWFLSLLTILRLFPIVIDGELFPLVINGLQWLVTIYVNLGTLYVLSSFFFCVCVW